MAKITILGTGTWGIALARLLVNNSHEVCAWSKIAEELEILKNTNVHPKLKNVVLPESIRYENELSKACSDAEIVMAVPSPFVRSVAREVSPYIKNQIIVDVAKGIEKDSCKTLSEVIKEELPLARVVVLSGPTHAEEVAVDMPTAIVSASEDALAAEEVQKAFSNKTFRVYTNDDVVGVEMCGALKNIIALATGISQGVSALWTLLFLTGKKTKLKLNIRDMKPDLKLLLPCLGLGLAPFVMQSTEAVINIAFNSSLQKYGGDIAVGTMTVAATLMQVMWMPAQGIGMGAQPIISFNYGAKNPDRCIKAIKTMLLLTGIYFISLWLIVQLFPKALMGIFTDDALLLENYNLIRIYVGATGFFFFQTTAQQGLVSVGKAKASLFIACLRKLILLVPLIYILPNFFGDKVFAVFLAEPVSDTISIITASVIFILVFGGEMKKLQKEAVKS